MSSNTVIADQIWDSFDDNERRCAHFALFPAEKMKPTDILDRDDSHAVTCMLMEKAAAMPWPLFPRRFPAPKPQRMTKLERLLGKY